MQGQFFRLTKFETNLYKIITKSITCKGQTQKVHMELNREKINWEIKKDYRSLDRK